MHFQATMQFFEISKKVGKRSCAVKAISVLCGLSLLLAQTRAERCKRRFTRQVIQYKDCLPKRIFTRSCVGSCVTHAHVSDTNPLKITRTCYQCKEAVTKQRKVKVLCPSREGTVPFKEEILVVPVPQECQCEACSFEDVIGVSHAKRDN